MTDLVKALRNRATWETATGITEPHEHIDWMAAEEIARLREENARLQTALEPFAARIDNLENSPLTKHACAAMVEIEHLRAARVAIREAGKNE